MSGYSHRPGDGHRHEFFDNWPSDTYCDLCGISEARIFWEMRITADHRKLARIMLGEERG